MSDRGGRPRKPRLVRVAVAALLAVLGVGAVTAAASGQESESGEGTGGEAEVRIVARRLDDGRTEFGLQQRRTGDSWGERLLPEVRFFPTDAGVGRWLRSSPLIVTIEFGDAAATLRIVARELDDGRIEFGLQQRLSDDSWGERLLPEVRFFPTDAGVGRWLRSSPLTVTATPAPPSESGDDSTVATPTARGFAAVAAGSHHSCGLRTDGTVACWGDNGWGHADTPSGTFSAVTAGGSHTCGLRDDGAVTCWGRNTRGQTNAPNGQFTIISAGATHSCGLRSDTTLTCWGENWAGQADAPTGEFSAVTAGGSHTCGLRTNATITCWGNNSGAQTDAPTGEFSAVTAGESHTCGLRTNATITCWGENWAGQADAPTGEFSAVTAGGSHTCGLRTNATITCWGESSRGQMHAPREEFSAVAAGRWHTCGLRSDASIACWGDESLVVSAPAGEFSMVSTGMAHSCGLRSDATITCWGANIAGQTIAPAGRYSAVAAGNWHSCALRDDATVACWGSNGAGQTDVPEGRFSDISIGLAHSCALRDDATVTCWGGNSAGQADPPDGRFSAVSAGGSHSCGLRVDATIACWGDNGGGEATPPAGRFSAVSAGIGYSCGLRADTTITCWGNEWDGRADAPGGRFSAVSARWRHSCALRSDGAITCWGYGGGLADPPGGSFSAIAVGDRHSCGLRSNGAAVCWTLAPLVAAPRGVEFVGADPGACRPRGVRADLTAGFPLSSRAAAATGTMRVAVLFLDFPDAAAAYSTRREAESSLAEAERYLETVSYGKLDVTFVPLHRWLRAASAHVRYLAAAAPAGQRKSLGNVEEPAAELADPDFDFAGFDSAMIVMPSSHFGDGNAGGSLDTEEGRVPTLVRINVSVLDTRSRPPLEWGAVAYHELAHNLGLVDYYSYDSDELPDASPGKIWVRSNFGPMGLGVRFLADERDPLLSFTVHHSNGTRSTQHTNSLGANEMLAWSRWQLGWLDARQIRCVTDPVATVSLTPVAAPGDGIAMVGIPLSDTEVIVVESRRKIGYDAGREIQFADGSHATLPALGTEGVLVYTVDAARLSGQLPLVVAGDNGDGQVDAYPILTEGESITIRGYTITVQSATATAHTVAITKSATT